MASATGTPVTVNTVPGTATPNQIFTVCTQIAIEKRDTSIQNVKNTYNAAMTTALSARKEAEKAAVALTDVEAKKTATKAAVEAYKSTAKSTQTTLAQSRKDIWASFETDKKACNANRSHPPDDRASRAAQA